MLHVLSAEQLILKFLLRGCDSSRRVWFLHVTCLRFWVVFNSKSGTWVLVLLLSLAFRVFLRLHLWILTYLIFFSLLIWTNISEGCIFNIQGCKKFGNKKGAWNGKLKLSRIIELRWVSYANSSKCTWTQTNASHNK